MLVSFNPMINTGSSVDAAYMNFLRCVKAICTAVSGTSSLTVNPFTNNTGTIDNTRNCILNIYANAEAGGWTESSSSNVINSGSFTAIASTSGFQYRFDAYTSSGKGSLPYNKLCFHNNSTQANSIFYSAGMAAAVGSFATYPYIYMTFGSSTTSDWTDTRFVPGGNAAGNNQMNSNYATAGASGSGYQNQSTTLTGFHSNSSSYSPFYDAFRVNATDRIWYLSVTANYCILWEQPSANSYTVSPYYANTLGTGAPNYSTAANYYGSIFYGGLRETQSWENAISTNPPWVCMQYCFNRQSIQATYTGTGNGPAQNFMTAYMCTINDSGVINTTPTTYVLTNQYTNQGWNFDISTGSTATTSYNYYLFGNAGAQVNAGTQLTSALLPPFITKDWSGYATSYLQTNTNTNQYYMPTVDPVTGTAVPSAFPIIARRITSGSWTPGGAIRGLYRSLSMPIATMKNYFAPGQTFNIYNSVTQTTDTYLPIIFNEDMFLVRYA